MFLKCQFVDQSVSVSNTASIRGTFEHRTAAPHLAAATSHLWLSLKGVWLSRREGGKFSGEMQNSKVARLGALDIDIA